MPRPSFASLDEDLVAWKGGQLSTLRSGKSFSFKPFDRFPEPPLPRLSAASTNVPVYMPRPLSALHDRLIAPPHELFTPRAAFPAATTLVIGVYQPKRATTPAAINRLHAGELLRTGAF